MQSVIVIFVMLLAAMYALFMALLPSIFNLAVCYVCYRGLKGVGINASVNIFLVVTISLILGINIRMFSIGNELLSPSKDVLAQGEKIVLDQNTLIAVSSNASEIRFKEMMFDTVYYSCNEATGCSYGKPKVIHEYLEEEVLNSGLQITGNQDHELRIELQQSIDDGVVEYRIRLLSDNTVIAQERHRRRLSLPGEEYIYESRKYDFDGFERYMFSNTFWDFALRGLFNVKQEAFIGGFIENNIVIRPAAKLSRALASVSVKADRNMEGEYQILNYQNTYDPVGCRGKKIERSMVAKNNVTYSSVTIASDSGRKRIVAEDAHLDKIICQGEKLYFVYLSRIHKDIMASEYDYNGKHIINDKIASPGFSWKGAPRVSYFQKNDDGTYLIQIKEALGKNEYSANSILFFASEK